jgi:hypothetical protein
MLDLPQAPSRFPHEKLAMETRNSAGSFEKNK